MKFLLYVLTSALFGLFIFANIPAQKFSGLAPLPGSITEGTSTAGWTDDGSIVRLNTQADNVGIGTINPSMKLQVQGAAYVTGNFDISGGTFNFSNGPATTSLYSNATGIGIGTSTPTSFFSVQGGLFSTGATSTLGTVMFASSTFGILGRKYSWPTSDGSNGMSLTTNGQGILSFASTSVATARAFSASATPDALLTLNRVDYSFPGAQGASSTVLENNGSGALLWYGSPWELLGNCQLGSASTSCSFIGFANRKNYMLVWHIVGKSGASIPQIKFHGDGAANYGWVVMKNGAAAATGSGDSQCNLVDTTDTVAEYSQIFISNSASGDRKLVNFNVNRATAAAAPPDVVNGACTWNNTSSVLNHIQLRLSAEATQSAGSQAILFGSRY